MLDQSQKRDTTHNTSTDCRGSIRILVAKFKEEVLIWLILSATLCAGWKWKSKVLLVDRTIKVKAITSAVRTANDNSIKTRSSTQESEDEGQAVQPDGRELGYMVLVSTLNRKEPGKLPGSSCNISIFDAITPRLRT